MVDGPTGAIGESAAYHHIELNYDISQSESQCLRQHCDAGVTIVDAPGYGSPYYSNDEIIEEYISKASHTFWINVVCYIQKQKQIILKCRIVYVII